MTDVAKDPKKGFDLEAIIESDKERKRRRRLERYGTITFRDYFELVKQNPAIAQRSHPRFYEIIHSEGVEDIPLAERWMNADKRYPLFSKHLFGSGIDEAVQEFTNYCAAGASGDPLAKQIIVFVGPPASGKSTIVDILMEALENYEALPVFRIAGCEVDHEPLLLLPRHLRPQISAELGIPIVGDLCPKCRHRLQIEYTEADGVVRWWEFPVEQFTFSRQGSRGIGSFEPGDDLSADITALVGRENVGVTSTKGYDHPDAYTLSGEIEKANRGILEGVEMLLNKPDILRVFISLCEEGQIKVQGSNFPHIYIDTVPVGHVNLTGYYKFSRNKEYEALHNRAYVIPVPYPVRVSDEIRVYQKLMQTDKELGKLRKAHIAPGTLELTALVAVATRLLPTDTVDLVMHAKAYDGKIEFSPMSSDKDKPLDVRNLIALGQANDDIGKREGMFGLSSRDVMAALNAALSREGEKNGCLTPKKALLALYEVFDHRMGFSPEEVAKYRELLKGGESGSIAAEYRRFVLEEVEGAFLNAYADLIEEHVRKYVQEARLYRAITRKFLPGGQRADVPRDEATGKIREPDEKFMRSIEEYAGVPAPAAAVFRGEVLEYLDDAGISHEYSPLHGAVRKKLLEDSKDLLKLILSADRPKGDEAKQRAKDLYAGLQERGFCEICARQIVEDAAVYLSE